MRIRKEIKKRTRKGIRKSIKKGTRKWIMKGVRKRVRISLMSPFLDHDRKARNINYKFYIVN